MYEFTNIDTLWILISTFLVFLMQFGFSLIETGTVRSKNTINVAMKNLVDIIFSIAIFWAVGFGLMFGTSLGGFIGIDSFFIDSNSGGLTTFFIFQSMFAGTAATIVSGAVAERIKFNGYIVITIVTVALIYPIFGHWAWSEGGWLKNLGFIDFAGSTVVHSIGAWIGLAGTLILGPRIGKFRNNKAQYFTPSNHNFIVFGVLILWFGWFGFNGGSLLAFNQDVSKILMNTTIAAAFGGIGGYMMSLFISKRVGVEIFSFGIIAGLVGITAGCHLYDAQTSALIGFSSAILMLVGDYILLHKLKIDDPLSAISVHGIAGVWGTLSVGLFAPLSLLESTRIEQISAQLIGIGSGFIWAFSISIVFFILLYVVDILRVGIKSEYIGLNTIEHNAKLPWIDTVESIIRIMKSGDTTLKVHEDRDTEIGLVAKFFNRLLGLLKEKNIALIQRNRILKKDAYIDPLTTLLNRRGLEENIKQYNMFTSHVGVMILDIDKFKNVNDTYGHHIGDVVIKGIASVLKKSLRDEDYVARWGGEEFVVVLINVELAQAQNVADKIRMNIEKCTFESVGKVTCSFGVSIAKNSTMSFEQVLENADKALYQAKELGRNRVCSW